jgi:copper chaperone CopZ
MNTTTIPIKGMHCKSCTVLISDVLSELPGVDSATVDLVTKKATITHDQHKISEAQLRKAIEEEGYTTG